MQLKDVEALLGITIAEDQKARYEARLEAAIDIATAYCKQDFKDKETGEQKIPSSVKMGISMIIQSMSENKSVSSQSLGDMSKSFFKNGTFDAALVYLDPYVVKRVGFR